MVYSSNSSLNNNASSVTSVKALQKAQDRAEALRQAHTSHEVDRIVMLVTE